MINYLTFQLFDNNVQLNEMHCRTLICFIVVYLHAEETRVKLEEALALAAVDGITSRRKQDDACKSYLASVSNLETITSTKKPWQATYATLLMRSEQLNNMLNLAIISPSAAIAVASASASMDPQAINFALEKIEKTNKILRRWQKGSKNYKEGIRILKEWEEKR